MITLLGAILGFLGSMIPEILAVFREKSDKQHELILYNMQLQQQSEGRSERLDALETQLGAQHLQQLYGTYRTHITWVDALNGTVRPVMAYAFFLLYAFVKITQITHNPSMLPWQLWGTEDQAIFSAIVSFYFGQRAFGKLRK